MNDLTQCIYASVATRKFDRAELEALLTKARRRNDELGITGMLLYTGDNFFQVLEGEEAAVEMLYEIVARDTWHSQVTKIIQEPVAQRAFSSWTMGLAMLDRKELDALPGTNDFFQAGSSLTNLEHGRAKKLLRAFSEGSWQAKLSGSRLTRAKP